MIATREDPVVFEVTTTLREWHKIWKSLYLDNQIELFEQISLILTSLLDERHELVSILKQSPSPNGSMKQQIVELKTEIVSRLDLGNRLLNLDLVPRDAEFRLVDPVDLSPIKLYELHLAASAKADALCPISKVNNSNNNRDSLLAPNHKLISLSKSNLNTDPSSITPTSCHLQMTLNEHHLTSLPTDESVEVYFTVVDAINDGSFTLFKPITEKFLIQIHNEQLTCGLPKTIFSNLGPIAERDICLYIQVYRVGKMIINDNAKATFGRQQSNYLMPSSNQDDSTSIASATTYISNAPRNRLSTVGNFNVTHKYRRPFGSTIVSLKDNSVGTRETSVLVKVVALAGGEFPQLSDLYAKRNQSRSGQNQPSIQIDMSMRFLICLQEKLPSLIDVSKYCMTEKRGFPDVVMPGDFKNDLYFTLEYAEFEKGGKSISKNIEATISLIDKSGLVIDNCISSGSNCPNVSSYKSCVYYHSNSPKWNESIKINVPLSEFDSAHIRIEFRHCSTKDRDKKFLGFSFLPLSDEDGTVIADKSHDLYLYKCDIQSLEDEFLNLCKYTSLPYGPLCVSMVNKPSQTNFSHSSREIVTVNTFLLSTKLTQNSDLLNLLKWRELIKRNNKDFEEALKRVLNLKGEEIVKFLQDILDTLFDTFTRYSARGDDVSSLIFKVLVHIFTLLEDPKYQHFKSVMDTYASAHFSATLVNKGLLVCLKNCLDSYLTVDRHGPIQKCFKVIRYIFQFIVRSKLLYSQATREDIDEQFLNDLREIFNLFCLMLENRERSLLPIQITFLESFPGALEQLILVVSPLELAKLVRAISDSVGNHRQRPALAKAKLIFMRKTALSGLIKSKEIRMLITENFCRNLDVYIQYADELELTHQVLEILIVRIHDYNWPDIYHHYELNVQNSQYRTPGPVTLKSVMTVGEINTFTKLNLTQANLLDFMISNVTDELKPFVNNMDHLLHLLNTIVKDSNIDRALVQKYCTCLLTILRLMSHSNFASFISRRKMDFPKLCSLFKAFRAVYNREWCVMQLTSHSILEHSIEEVCKDILLNSDSHSFNRYLSSHVKLMADFITHPTLQLEVFSERKKNYVLNVFGDLRLKFSAQLMRSWAELTPNNICDLIPTTIQPFLDAALLPCDELQQAIIPVFWDMIDAEEKCKRNSRQLTIERCLIDNLDLFFNLDRGSKQFIINFSTILKRLMKENSPVWERQGNTLINSFKRIMQLLINYRRSIDSFETRYKQMSCLVELLNYYKEQKCTDLHLKYLYKLCDMHLEVGNYVEAAFSLKLYADELKWCPQILSPLEGYQPEEQEWRRKEILYLRIIEYFDVGKCWEEGIALCKELASFYENFLVDYSRVSATLKKLAQYLDNILTEHRPEREYFRVEFIGANLPDFVRGKEFVYRGGEYERLATFIQRINFQFPDAQILSTTNKQSIEKETQGQYIVVSNVKPVPFLQEHLKSSQRNINDKIIQYYLHNRLDTFSHDVPIRRGPPLQNERSGEMNVRNLWVGRTILKLKKQLPSLLPWSEVSSFEYIEISPVNHAIETVSSMNLELIKLIQSYKNEPNKQLSPLTMRLQGVIEAAVNGGPSVFVNAFLKQHPGEQSIKQDPELLVRLSDLIKQQFSILDMCLALHAKLAPPDMLPLHARLVERLQSTRRTLLEEPIENNYEVVNHGDDAESSSSSSCISKGASPRPDSALSRILLTNQPAFRPW